MTDTDDDWPFFDAQPEDRHAAQERKVDATPFFSTLGLSLEQSATDYARLQVVAGPQLANPNGITHGGVHATLVDTAVGQALTTTIKRGFLMSTIELDIKYFKPTTEGVLAAEGRVVRKGKRIAHGEAELRNGDGELVGKGWCVYAIMKREQA